MQLEKLRARHSRLIYRSYKITSRTGHFAFSYEFLLEPDITFTPELLIPFSKLPLGQIIDNFAFHLGLVELISYWKCACPAEIVIEAGVISEEQITWWKDLFIHGLGEFFFTNRINPFENDFLKITLGNAPSRSPREFSPAREFSPEGVPANYRGDLILTSGGKDSVVTLNLLRNELHQQAAVLLNPTRAALDNARLAGYRNPVILRRTIDRKLLELNSQGYLNGHTPFSAYLAFAGLTAAALNGYTQVIVSNERSADEENLISGELAINHQYSKSYRFECRFQEYVEKFISSDLSYFSFLRPLYDLQVTRLFANFPEHHHSFRSCNVGERQDTWCKRCAKCAFVYLSLSAFLDDQTLFGIFSGNLFENADIQHQLKLLAGLEGEKPFDCVGTIEECRLAILLSYSRRKRNNQQISKIIEEMAITIGGSNIDPYPDDRMLYTLHGEHRLSAEYEDILLQAIRNVDQADH